MKGDSGADNKGCAAKSRDRTEYWRSPRVAQNKGYKAPLWRIDDNNKETNNHWQKLF